MEPRSAHPFHPGHAAAPPDLAPKAKSTARAIAAALRARRDALQQQPKPNARNPLNADADRSRKAPRLRLVAADPELVVKPTVQPTQHAPIADPTDPRWVLAVRTAERLEGSILRPEHREALLALGKSFGLTPFDASLILAIVQDQARRGYAPAHCPTAAEPQLRMVPPVHRTAWLPRWSARTWLLAAVGFLAFTALELAALSWFFSR